MLAYVSSACRRITRDGTSTRDGTQFDAASIMLCESLSPVPNSDRFRPKFHLTPPECWMNDPNGALLSATGYHLFYQHNPKASTWGEIVWRHARSDDLVHWQDLGPSLDAADRMAFSGSALECTEYQLGISTDAGAMTNKAIVAAYTAHDAVTGNEQQRIAYSFDSAQTWTPLVDGPAIPLDQPHFRDPRILWHAETQCWIMLIVRAIEHRVVFYNSRDLRSWQETGSFHVAEEPGVEWECPDLVRFDDPASKSRSLWMLKLDVSRGALAGGSGGKYFLGEFDGREFRSLPLVQNGSNPRSHWAWLDYGKDFYAAQTFSGVPESDNPVWIAWASNWQYARQTPTDGWRGCQSIPRRLSLRSTDGTYQLLQEPVSALKNVRSDLFAIHSALLGGDQRHSHYVGLCFDLECRFENWSAEEFGLVIAAGDHCETRLIFYPERGVIVLDRTMSGDVDFSDQFPGRHEAPCNFEGSIDLRVVLDQSILEVFINDGAIVFTDLIFPDVDAGYLEPYARHGEVELRSLRCWELEART